MKKLSFNGLKSNAVISKLFGLNDSVLACSDRDGDGCEPNKGDYDNCHAVKHDHCNGRDYISI